MKEDIERYYLIYERGCTVLRLKRIETRGKLDV